MLGGLQLKLMMAGVAVAVVVGAYFYGVSAGKNAERDKWMKVELERSQAFADTLLELEATNLALTEENAAVEAAAEQDKAENRRLTNEIEQLIDRTPTVRTKRIEVPGNCPAIECPVPDIPHDFRLHNCAIDPAPCDLSDTPSPGSGITIVPET